MQYQLAQINIAKLLKPIEHPQIADFVNQLDAINALAEGHKGFVWRLKDEVVNNAIDLNPFNDKQLIVNMSVWQNVETLKDYVYNSDHVKVFIRRKEWFEKPTKAHMALWWIKKDEFPSAFDGKKRLEYLWQHGPTSFAFDFKSLFKQPD